MSSPSHWSAIRYLNREGDIDKTRNRLPHWQQDGASYFHTFRLADSLPESILAPWRKEREAWLRIHPQPWDDRVEREYHQRFSSAIDRHLDAGHGDCVLRDPANSVHLEHALKHFDGDRYLLHAWVIMPNHAHILVSLAEGTDLGKTIASWKRYSSNQIQQSLGTSGTLWQKDYYDRMIRNSRHFQAVARYISNNPAKARLPDSRYRLYQAPWL